HVSDPVGQRSLFSPYLAYSTFSQQSQPGDAIKRLPAIMGKGAIGLRHFMSLFLLLNRCTSPVEGVQQFGGEFLRHAVSATGSGYAQSPAHRQRLTTFLIDFGGDLIGRATNTTGANFDSGCRVPQGCLEYFDSFALGLVLDNRQRIVHHAAGDTFLATAH